MQDGHQTDCFCRTERQTAGNGQMGKASCGICLRI